METAELSVKIAQRIAIHEDVDAAALDPPLYEVIDVDALETLICSQSHDRAAFTGVISFNYRGNTVTVDKTGTVSVTSSTGTDHNSDPATSDESSDRRTACEPQ